MRRPSADPCPNTGPVESPTAAGPPSQLDVFPRDLARVVDAQPQLRSEFNVSRLADILPGAELVLVGGAIPDRDRTLALALVFDHRQQLAVDGDRIGAEHHLLR